MTYKDDLEKLRRESPLNTEENNSVEVFTKEEKSMTLWQKISLPFVRNSFLSVLFFVLLTLLWIAISHTIVSAVRGVSRGTLLIFMIKDTFFMVLLAAVMYRIFCTQFANTYHLEEDNKKSQEQAKEWEAIQHSMMETIPETLVYTLDRNFRYTSFNNRHKYSMLRLWHQEIHIGDCILDHISDEAKYERLRRDLERARNGEYISDTEKFGDNDLTAMYWQTYYAPILDEDKRIIGVSCFINNITSLKQSQNMNLFLSYHDPLTRLYNRVYCEDLFAQLEREPILPYSIIVTNVSGMRQINDNYGRQTGDNLLIKMSELLTKSIKDNGIIARWGGDEFIVLLPHVDEATTEALANICKCDFSGVTVNGIPLRAHIGFATRKEVEKTLPDVLRSAEHMSTQSRL
ncbi:MAG: diguanylate cyclase [Clostridiales bacterium]|nr:diguanylate cyclase [Clostridiales bacterium]